ncbi:MAG: sterol-binding protein, partial [Chloroflexi bacterium]|nr:sterol-binding protein [Chloroflexota bacterium]
MPTSSEVFNEINNRLQADPSKVKGVTANYAFDLSGEDS